MSREAWAALIIAVYGAILSSVLAWRQIWQERRRLRIIARNMVWVQPKPGEPLEVLEVRAICEGHRPVYVFAAGVKTEDNAIYHPLPLPLERIAREMPTAPVLLNDGEGVTFYFDILSFEDEQGRPKSVWVRDQGDREYTKRLSRRQRRELAEHISKLRARLGPEVSSQEHLVGERYTR